MRYRLEKNRLQKKIENYYFDLEMTAVGNPGSVILSGDLGWKFGYPPVNP